LEKLTKEPEPSGDDLALAREVMRELYAFAARPVPTYFLEQPVDQKFSTGRLEWHDLLYGVSKAGIVREGSRIRIEFKPDMQRDEVSYYESNLPLGLNKDRKGNTILINAPDEFLSWLNQDGTPPGGTRSPVAKTPKGALLRRLRGWLRKGA